MSSTHCVIDGLDVELKGADHLASPQELVLLVEDLNRGNGQRGQSIFNATDSDVRLE